MLSCIKSDILNLRQRGMPGGAPVVPIAADDDSIRVQVCHSPLREIEALQDALLRQFEKNPRLKPSDIVVMTPDIETYAPFIHAVFGCATHGVKRIPYTIADCPLLSDSPTLSAFLSLIAAARGRFTAGEILSLLETVSLHEAFELTEKNLDLIRVWISDARICWGLDEETRAMLDIPIFAENTWKSGVERLLLGIAIKDKDQSPFLGVAALSGIDGEDAVVLGRFLDFLRCLTALRDLLNQSLSPKDWAAALKECAQRFFIENEDNAFEMQLLRTAIVDCATAADHAGFTGLIDSDIMQNLLGSTLKRSASSSGFLAGAVTFCAMLPMRGIPFKIVCMIGMNDAAFPRRSLHTGWNLMASQPRAGDRSLEKEDRYIFLEALLSARDLLYMSYIGQDLRNNAPRQPSVTIAELLEYADRAFLPPDPSSAGANSAAAYVTVPHRLQAYSPSYFKPGNRLFSYSEENFAAALNAAALPQPPAPFFPTPLDSPPDEWRLVDIDDLLAFYKHPVKYLFRKRLGMRIRDADASPPDREPFFIEGLDAYALGSDLVRRFLRAESKDACYEAFKAASLLPHGTVGNCAFNYLADEAMELTRRIAAAMNSDALAPRPLTVTIGPFTVSGSIARCGPSGFLDFRFARLKPRDMVQFWIAGLIISAAPNSTALIANTLIARDGSRELARIENAQSILRRLLDLYWQGLTHPLRFFPNSSWAYAKALAGGKSAEESMRDAQKAWIGDDFCPGESLDPYYNLCFTPQTHDPLTDEFSALSVEIFGPLIDTMKAAP